MATSTDDVWEHYGSHAPYYGVLTDPIYRGRQVDDAARSAFFASGEEHVKHVLSTVRTHIDPTFRPRHGVDFGCGVGRVVVPLASHCERVTGVDVSTSMLEEARRNCDRYGVRNAQLLMSDDELTLLREPYDFVHSFIVFQHLAPERGLRVAHRLIDQLEPGGIAVLHFTYATRIARWRRALRWTRSRVRPINSLVNLARHRPHDLPTMRMSHYDLNSLVELIHVRANPNRIHLELTDHGGALGVLIYAQKGATVDAG
jgi:SAM-dependent methyltransferase